MKGAGTRVLLTVLILLAHGVSRAGAANQIQPIVRSGDQVGSVKILSQENNFQIGTLNDRGQMTLVTENADGGELLFQYSDGKLVPIVVGGQTAPGGSWPKDVGVLSPVSMNQAGNMSFAADVTVGGATGLGTFLWDFQAQQLSLVVPGGTAAVYDITFDRGGDWTTVINSSNQIVFSSTVQTKAGETQSADFLFGINAQFLPVALPDQVLPDDSVVLGACNPSLNDAGVVAFVVQRKGDPLGAWSAYRWESSKITPLAVVGSALPDGHKVGAVLGVWVNNKNQNVLLNISVDALGGAAALYLASEGKLIPVAAAGQDMPGGGKLRHIQDFGISAANDAGQHAFLATLDDGSTAIYQMDADGMLSLLLKSGTVTDQGTITNVGEGAGLSTGVALNSKGQFAATLQFDGGTDTVVLVTPVQQ
jgi:hypothetical protein